MNVTWTEAAGMQTGCAGGAAASIQGRLTIAGGTAWIDGQKQWLRRVDQYVFESGTWVPAPEMPWPSAYAPFAVIESHLHVYGGFDGRTPATACLDFDGTEWRETGPAPEGRFLAAGATFRDVPFLFGGCRHPETAEGLSGTVVYRDACGSWREAAVMAGGPVALCAAAVCAERIWVFGGLSEDGNTARVNSFHPDSGEWQAVRPLPEACRGMSAAAVDDRTILLAGGWSVNGPLRSVWAYDTEADACIALAPLPIGVMLPMLVLVGRTVCVCGGEDAVRSRSSRLFLGQLQYHERGS